MVDDNNNEIWVFLSHSNKDYEKVRQVRNILEEQSLRPLMFFLHCLSDDDEIDTLIKREIDCRTRFILCDSENARKSKWVQKEVAYIKSQNRICETIDISKDPNEISSDLQNFINKTRLFISYNQEEYNIAKRVYERLSRYDFSVYMDMYYDPEIPYQQNYLDTLNAIEKSAKTGGFVISIMNERILYDWGSCSRGELLKAIRDNNVAGNSIPNIIPFVTKNSLVDKIAKDTELYVLTDCGIQCKEGLSSKTKSDEIIKRIVTQLMTLGSIKVQADNFRRESITGEADFLYGLLEEIKDKNIH